MIYARPCLNVHCYNINCSDASTQPKIRTDFLWDHLVQEPKLLVSLCLSFFLCARLFCNAWLPENVLKFTYCFRTMNDVINICCALNIFTGNQNPFSAAHPCEQRPTQINVSNMQAEENTSTLSGKADWRLRLLRIWLMELWHVTVK